MNAEDLEEVARFDCFGSGCSVHVTGAGAAGSAEEATALARAAMLGWHRQFSRFIPESELSRVNADPSPEVAVSRMMARLAEAVVVAGERSHGLVDATLGEEIERAGYRGDLEASMPLADALDLAPPRHPARPAREPGWSGIRADRRAGTITRPPGTPIDSGGLAKGLFADVLAELLDSHPSFAVNCAGDLAIGGAEGVPRPINVESPFDRSIIHTFHGARTGVATSGIGRRSWIVAGRPAHHLLDPSTGTPAFTGIVQATALAPSALEAEIRAKAALLSGPAGAPGWLGGGGVIVFDDGSHEVLEPPLTIDLSELAPLVRPPAARA